MLRLHLGHQAVIQGILSPLYWRWLIMATLTASVGPLAGAPAPVFDLWANNDPDAFAIRIYAQNSFTHLKSFIENNTVGPGALAPTNRHPWHQQRRRNDELTYSTYP